MAVRVPDSSFDVIDEPGRLVVLIVDRDLRISDGAEPQKRKSNPMNRLLASAE
jgi:hypothetical protein